MLCAKADKVFMRIVQHNVFLILNSVSVTFFTDPELIIPSIFVKTHSAAAAATVAVETHAISPLLLTCLLLRKLATLF